MSCRTGTGPNSIVWSLGKVYGRLRGLGNMARESDSNAVLGRIRSRSKARMDPALALAGQLTFESEDDHVKAHRALPLRRT